MNHSIKSTAVVIDALSRDSRVSGDAAQIAAALRKLYPEQPSHLLDSIDHLLADDQWSGDRQPYAWLEAIRDSLTAPASSREPCVIYLSGVEDKVESCESNIFADGPHSIETRIIRASGVSNYFDRTAVEIRFPSSQKAAE